MSILTASMDATPEVQVGTHPESWKTAKGTVIPKPGKPDHRQVRVHRIIALLDPLGKLLERTAAHLIADQPECKRSLHEGQYGCRRRRACVDAVAILISDAQKAWSRKNVAGALLMDVKSAFNNVSRGHLIGRMMALGVGSDLVRWTESFVSDRKVRLVLNGQEGGDHEVDTGIPQGSPVSPILFIVYLSGLFGYVGERVASQASRPYLSWTTSPGRQRARRRTGSARPWSKRRQRLRSGQQPTLSLSTPRRRKRSS